MDMYGNVLIDLIGIRASRLLQKEIDKVKAKRSLVDNCEVYVNLNEGVTVLKHGNSVYKAKAEKLGYFDIEKGVMICLLKAVGIKTTDYLNILERVKYNNAKSKKIKNCKCAIKCKCKKGK